MSSLNGSKVVENGITTGTPQPQPDFTGRACVSAYAIMGGIWILMFALVLFSVRHATRDTWQILLLLGSTLVLILLWLGSFRISLMGNTVTYRSLFGGTRSLQLSEIKSAEIKIDTSDKFGPVYKLILWPESSGEKKQIVVNMKVFSKADLTRVFDFLGPKLQTKRRFSMFSAE